MYKLVNGAGEDSYVRCKHANFYIFV